MLTLQVKEQIIENLTPDEKFIRGTVGAKCQIKFDEFWSKYEKTVVFQRKCQKPINIIVNELDNEIEIPYEILEKHGKFKIGVFGIIENEVLPTLWSTDIEILCGTDTHGTNPQTYTPSEIDQLRLSKQDKLIAGSGITIENNVISSDGITDYEQLENKPQINGVELLGNKSLTDLGISTNIKNSIGSSSLQQTQDTGYTGIAIKTKNPNAYALDNTLTDNEPIGAKGAFAASFGGVTSAQGKRSFACGTNTIAKGKYSFASGDNAVALGNESFVSGYNTVAKGSQSFAIGSGTQAIGQNSVSTGSNNISRGDASFTGGQDCVTGENALRSFAYGKGLKALVNDAFVVGKFNQYGDKLFEVGDGYDDTHRHSVFSVSSGGEVIAAFLYTNSIVCQNFRVNDTGVWIGSDRVLTTNATDFMPIVNSNLNLNNGSGTYSIIQKDNIAIASGSAAFGISTQATAGASMATGVETQANGLHSFAGGNNSIAGYANQFIVGKFNSNKPDTYFEVGNGADNSNRSNAFEVYADGHAEIQTMGSSEKSVTTKKYVDDIVGNIEALLGGI